MKMRPLQGLQEKKSRHVIVKDPINITEIKVPVKWFLEKIENKNLLLCRTENSNIWPLDKMSKFIELIYLNIPIDHIYLSERKGRDYDIMTGSHQISTMYKFYESKFFFTKLEHVHSLSGLAYFQLGDNLKNKFLDYKINMKLFRGNAKMAAFIMRKQFVI
ncbi:MAG: hypothetical protein O4965_08660 [Trichodesmium sp. St19_bin1]|nr:hypothetical protein [Trichodesmium sp. St19_bin1]